ncbi:sensor histidine kinase [Spongiactinospora rosea]|uniref:histidine kinase n=1 Tax=Spongiactinospora rosea TaxID=2248750 RepID=A0A366M282_9ACTN|nr:sensor histidine kinase [Spongiactinospora rosea]
MRSARYLTVALFTGVATLPMPMLLLGATATVAAAGLGLILLPTALLGLRRWADLARRRVGAYLGEAVPSRYREPGGRFWQTLTDPATWRDIGWMFAHIAVGIPFGAIGLIALAGPVVTVAQAALWWVLPADEPLTLLGMPVTGWGTALGAGAAQLVLCVALLLWATPALARVHARMSRALLRASAAERLAERVDALTESRADALEAHAAELRRIERDLHDGAQAQLVALAMRLGVAERTMAEDPQTARRLLREAQSGAEEAMAELRDVVRTIYPPILADRGLDGAASALAARCPVPVQIAVGPLGAVPAAVEATAYFVIAEALTNVAKHARARRARVGVRRDGPSLLVELTDDGIGGVDESRGSGIAGIRRRVAALDGTTRITSPPGGPTTLEVTLPCES